LVDWLARSQEEVDRELAVEVVSALAEYDYEFTRDTLIFCRVDEDRPAAATRGLASEAAMTEIPRLMRDRLTPEQVDDFNTRLGAHGDWFTTRPARPDEP
jgi:hypothetical protein